MSKNRRLEMQLAEPASQADKPPAAGRIVHDSRGNAIWDWDVATGVLESKSVSELLVTLDRPGTLSLEREIDHSDQGGDPYNTRRR